MCVSVLMCASKCMCLCVCVLNDVHYQALLDEDSDHMRLMEFIVLFVLLLLHQLSNSSYLEIVSLTAQSNCRCNLFLHILEL